MAYDAFLKLNGINGESQKQNHKNEIDIMSFSWGTSTPAR
jgi:type VI secretion system secreted protein Hcp